MRVKLTLGDQGDELTQVSVVNSPILYCHVPTRNLDRALKCYHVRP